MHSDNESIQGDIASVFFVTSQNFETDGNGNRIWEAELRIVAASSNMILRARAVAQRAYLGVQAQRSNVQDQFQITWIQCLSHAFMRVIRLNKDCAE